MAIDKDPEGRETDTLHAMADFKDARVLEIGCGNGRLTWRYAGKAAYVKAIDPDQQDIAAARSSTPAQLKRRVSFQQSTIGDFSDAFPERNFDIAVFAWSL